MTAPAVAGPAEDSAAFLACLAWRLTDPALVHAGRTSLEPPRDERDRIARLLQQPPGGLDPAFARDLVEYSFDLVSDGCELHGLGRIAEATVALQDGTPRARPGDARRLTQRALDSDALVLWHRAASPPPPGGLSNAARLDWPPVLPFTRGPFDRVLSQPLAETHLHLAGALPPSLFWARVLRELVPVHQVLPEGLLDAGRHETWTARLRRAVALLEHLGRCRGDPLPRSDQSVAPLRLEALLRRLTPFDRPGRTAFVESPTTTGSAVLADLLAERQILWFHLWECRQAPHDRGRAESLIEYLRIKNAFHQALLLARGSRGLRRFSETRARRRFVLRAAGTARRRARILAAIERRQVHQLVELCLREAAPGIPRYLLSSSPSLDLEIRVSLPPRRALRATLQAWLGGVRDALAEVLPPPRGGPCTREHHRRTGHRSPCPPPPLRVGFVVHLKRREQARRRGPEPDPQAGRLADILDGCPALRPFFVGLDVASDELSAPPRAFIRTYRELRRRLDHEAGSGGSPPVRLGFTYHVGEDFRDLLTGIRHVDEAACLLDLREGDRLGHALALGWPPEDFYRRRASAFPTRGEHALDLLWSWIVLRDGCEDDRSHGVEARRLLERQVTGRHDLEAVARRAVVVATDSASEHALLAALDITGRPADAPVELARDSRWLGLVDRTQQAVRQRVARRNLVLETCPTSNLLIGAFRSYADLPCLHLCRHGLPDAGGPVADLPLSLNTDNPGLLQTTLHNEYASVGQALLDQRQPLRAVQLWLDEARQVGLASSFIPPWAPSGVALRDTIDDFLSGTPER